MNLMWSIFGDLNVLFHKVILILASSKFETTTATAAKKKKVLSEITSSKTVQVPDKLLNMVCIQFYSGVDRYKWNKLRFLVDRKSHFTVESQTREFRIFFLWKWKFIPEIPSYVHHSSQLPVISENIKSKTKMKNLLFLRTHVH